ncbi:PucR family transcriptional regulator [Fusibacter ferrireducens]|uniref:PucR family transcriptional regulator n=1 Tax=Fusibacter ferrireducens TaxID=2785058 RepID=A0ABR9ZQL3_9FIRM|nr:PucR family transcriptional regulator [Fusibacter ferrireducens]MBF4692433.1 PucR family transcriptional regulator [Fusibacter ferrireducens]
MGFKIKNLLELDMLRDSEVICGNEHLDNEIIWINMLEILDELNSLQVGELLITTGYNLDNEELHKNLIYTLHKKKLAGLAIQPGYYIDKIPDYIKQQGEKYHFPIIQIPKKITFSHFTRVIIKNINNGKAKHNIGEESLLADFIENKMISETKLNELIECGFNEPYSLTVMIFSIEQADHGFILESDTEYILDCFDSLLSKIASNYLFEKYQDHHVILIRTDMISGFIYKMQELISTLSDSNPNFSMNLGISSHTNTFSSISKLYIEAMMSHDILKTIQAKKGVCSYEHVSLFQMLGHDNASENIFRLLNETIIPIMNYDAIHNCDYVETLKIYFSNNYNLSVTSDKLFIHRHTLRYRLQKIEAIFNIDLKDALTLFKYSIALQLNNLYH